MKLGFFLGLLCSLGLSLAFANDTKDAVDIDVQSATAKVGEKTAVIISVTPKPGYKISKAYRNRVFELSSLEDSVEFEQRMVRGVVKDGNLTLTVGATPVKVGEHPINGLMRIGFHDGERMDFKSIPIMTTVTGTE